MLIYSLPNVRIRRHMLDAEYARGGVPVFEATYKEWKERFYPIDKDDYERPSQFMGVYFNNPEALKHDLPKRFIIINRQMPNYEKLMVFWHELGHHGCVKARCKCAKPLFDHRKTELHAELSALYIAHQRQFKQMTFELVKEMIEGLEGKSFHWIRNSQMMVKTPIFQEAHAFVADQVEDWLKGKKIEHLRQRFDEARVDPATRKCRWLPSRFIRQFANPEFSTPSVAE